MEYVIWGAQVLLALVFGVAGIAQVTTPAPFARKLSLSRDAVRLVGVAAIVAAVTVVGPQAGGFGPLVTSGAAMAMTALCFWYALRLTKQQWPRYATVALFVMVVTVFVAVFRLPL